MSEVWAIVVNDRYSKDPDHFLVDRHTFMTVDDQQWLLNSISTKGVSSHDFQTIVDQAYRGKHPSDNTNGEDFADAAGEWLVTINLPLLQMVSLIISTRY